MSDMKVYYFLMGIIWSVIGIITMSVWVCCLIGIVDLEMLEKLFFPCMFTFFIVGGVSFFLNLLDKG